MIPGTSPTLRDRLLGKIVMPGPATPCATYVGAYNRPGQRSKRPHGRRRPVICAGGRFGVMLYVAPTLLRLADIHPPTPDHVHACHVGCPTGVPWNGVYSCVDLDHLQWGTRKENEGHKREQ